ALARGRAEEREQNDLEVLPLPEAFLERSLAPLPLRLHARKHRRLVELEPDVNRDAEQDERNQERYPPTPALEASFRHSPAAEPDDDQRDEEAERCGGLDPARMHAPLLIGSVLGHVGRCASVFAAERQTLCQT